MRSKIFRNILLQEIEDEKNILNLNLEHKDITPQNLYLIVLTCALCAGFLTYKYHRALQVLVGLIFLAWITEMLVEFHPLFAKTNPNFRNTRNYLYSLYIPLEYLLYAYFFYSANTTKKLRRAILISVPIFIVLVFLMYDYSRFENVRLATEVYNTSGVLTVCWSLWTLFVIEPIKNVKFTFHPLFWFCAGIIIFHTALIPYNYLLSDMENSNMSWFPMIKAIFQKGFNIWLYLAFIIGFICSHRMKKYFSP